MGWESVELALLIPFATPGQGPLQVNGRATTGPAKAAVQLQRRWQWCTGGGRGRHDDGHDEGGGWRSTFLYDTLCRASLHFNSSRACPGR